MLELFVRSLRQQQQVTQVKIIRPDTSKMKINMTKKAPSSMGWAFGSCCNFSHILFRRFSVSSPGSILFVCIYLFFLSPTFLKSLVSQYPRCVTSPLMQTNRHAEHLLWTVFLTRHNEAESKTRTQR